MVVSQISRLIRPKSNFLVFWKSNVEDNVEEYRRIILWRKIILKIILYNCDFEGFMG